MLIQILSYVIWVYSWILVIYALLSWVPPLAHSVLGQLLERLVRPYLGIFDRIPTRFGAFDFEVVVGLIGLFILQRFLSFF